MENLPTRLTTAALTATLVGLLATACAHHTSGTPTSPHPSTTASVAAPRIQAAAPTTTARISDEDQARATVTAFNDAYNSQNWSAYTELMCAAMRAQFAGTTMDYVKKGRANNGPATIKSMTIAIDGDSATATLTGASEALGPGTITLPLKREDGWKVCQVYQR